MNNDSAKPNIEKQLKQTLQQDVDNYDAELSLQNVLTKAGRQTATKDLIGLMFSWIWILFALFGASAFKLKNQHTINNRQTANQQPENNQ